MENDVAYRLWWNFDKERDDKYDASLIPFDGSNDILTLTGNRIINLPEKIYFEANIRTLKETDFPLNNVNWPIISKKMYNTILSCGNFPHKTIPLIMIDDTVPKEERLNIKGLIRSEIINEDFMAIQITGYTDFFDYKKSVYEEDDLFPGEVGVIRKLAIKIPPSGLPPLFIIKECGSKIFISSEAKEAFEKAGIKNVVFENLSDVH